MSNIFEIDGEIEDNDDDGKKSGDGNEGNLNDEEQSVPEGTEEEASDDTSEEEESVSIVFGNAEDESEEESDSEAESANEDNVPWFDKVLSDDDESANATSQESEIIEEVETPEEPETEESHSIGSDNVEEAGRVEDVTQEEIDEVLAELDQSEKEMEAYGYDDDIDQIEDEEESEVETVAGDDELLDDEEESFDDIFPPSNRKPIGVTAWIFLMLFLIMLSLFSYYQFYDGEKFSINFHHKSEGAMNQLDSLAQLNEESQQEISQLMTKMEALTQEIRKKTADFEALKNDTSRVTYTVDESGESAPADSKINLNEGTYYQVQLIALQQYHPDFGGADFSFYVDKEDGFSKMLMGAFLSEDHAKDLYEKVQRSGFNDAFIVKKVNGERVEYDPNK